MLHSFFAQLQEMLGVAPPLGFATPTFIIEPENRGGGLSDWQTNTHKPFLRRKPTRFAPSLFLRHS